MIDSHLFYYLKKKTKCDFERVHDLDVIELGCGEGKAGAAFACLGNQVTLLDRSKSALECSKRNFRSLGLEGHHVVGDLLCIEENLKSKFDLAISIGVCEHFLEEPRKKILKSHWDVLKPFLSKLIDAKPPVLEKSLSKEVVWDGLEELKSYAAKDRTLSVSRWDVPFGYNLIVTGRKAREGEEGNK